MNSVPMAVLDGNPRVWRSQHRIVEVTAIGDPHTLNHFALHVNHLGSGVETCGSPCATARY
jgi:hypothetical protein